MFASQVGGLAKYVELLGAKTFIWDSDARPEVKCEFYQVSRLYRKFARQNEQLVGFRPTHIYARTYQSAIASKELAKKTGAKLVYSMRGADVAEAMMAKNLRGYIIGAFAAWSVRRALKADCGIIIRDDTLVNQVASPIKVGEYLAAGLGVIASPFIGDVGRDLADKDFACLVDENTPVEKIVEFVKSMNLEKRQQATAWVRDHLTYEGNRAAVEELMS